MLPVKYKMGIISSINNIFYQPENIRTDTQRKDLNFLIGNVENLPHSDRRLFFLSRLFLTSEYDQLKSNSLRFSGDIETSGHQNTNCNMPESDLFSTHLFSPIKQTLPLHCLQTFIQWKATLDMQNIVYLCSPLPNKIYLQPLDHFPDFVLNFSLMTAKIKLNFFELLQGFCQLFFLGLEIILLPPMLSSVWEIRSRVNTTTGQQQLCVNDFFPKLKSKVPVNGVGLVGIIWTDLYPEGFKHVLGEASIEHRSAVVSFGRYETVGGTQVFKEITNVDAQLVWKLFRTLSHEICHLLGLKHCQFFSCAMNESQNMNEALSQPLDLCPVCLRKVQHICGFDVLERYRRLTNFLQMVSSQLDGDTFKFDETIHWLERCIGYLS